MTASVLAKEFKTLSKEKWLKLDLLDENLFRWDIALMVLNPESAYYGGYFKCTLSFPATYPYAPPDFRFIQPLWHPNIYSDGRVCISILHAPGDDAMSGETAGERWNPAQTAYSVLISILTLLDDAEVASPANVDASIQYRDDQPGFRDRVSQDVQRTKTQIPRGFVYPTQEDTKVKVDMAPADDDFWNDSEGEADFGDFDDDDDNGSGTSGDDNGSEDEDLD
ncbi:hypothetical protein BT93_L1356 [Corymbia citriodora subsp. variegata]|uniref:UBC core domain-containing protein n=1 Tax=Corymbia citriodora subsp. variegata TaxID=360336 RepID=A0A8T0CG62_CORYI|nr:hypothetical protein BT93_L1356 [Corymbia citriodora subsp. variegata]